MATLDNFFTKVRKSSIPKLEKMARTVKLRGYDIKVNKQGQFIVSPKKTRKR